MGRELYKKYRPKSLSEVIGQNAAVEMLAEMLEAKDVPHTLLFSGPSGCGKTTLARILRRELGCGKFDFCEMNTADLRGIDDVREIRSRIWQAPISGKCRVWLIDEAHKLTNDAQNAFLKMLEDTPNHVYFFLATTDPQKLLRTIRNRCTEITVKPLSKPDITKLVNSICGKEHKKIPIEVLDKIVEHCEGSARKALVFLGQVLTAKTTSKMLEVIVSTTAEAQAIAIARALFNKQIKWPEMAKLLSELQDEEPEQIRWMVLGYAKAIILKGKGPMVGRAYIVISAFRDNFYDSKHAGLVAACYEVIFGSET